MVIGLGLALALRLDIAGGVGVGHVGSGSRPIASGLMFALALLGLAGAGAGGFADRTRQLSDRAPVRTRMGAGLVWGLVGAAVLVAFPLALRPLQTAALGASLPSGYFAVWAAVVSLVAVAEEVLLRGVLFAAIDEALGTATAVSLTAIAFALLHVPLYGPGVVLLDLAVGIWLGTLRVVSGSVVAPASAHALADLAAWWLV
jgi:membrane protease YdiL (CAAX protease family)